MEIADRADAVTGALLDQVVEHTREFLSTLHDGPVQPAATAQELRALLAVPLGEDPEEPLTVMQELNAGVKPGLMLMPSGRFFGFVIGGTLPVAMAADWLTSAWDQNAGLFAATPAACVVEDGLNDRRRSPAQYSLGLLRQDRSLFTQFV